MYDCNNYNHLSEAKKLLEESSKMMLKGLQLAYGLEYENDNNFDGTPERIARALLEKCSGINSYDICKEILSSTFDSEYDGYVIVSPIRVISICPHHFENVIYKVYFGYMPNGKCVGLSKIPRVIKLFGKQPMLQEDYVKKLADLFEDILKPKGLGILAIGEHNCMTCRGINEKGVTAKTPIMRGEFANLPGMKEEFYHLCSQGEL